MSIFWSERVKTSKPYVYGEQPKDKNYIKLNTNENAYPPSEKVLSKLKEMANEDLRLYPDPNCDDLKNEIAKFYDIEKNQIFIGNGSDEVLAFSFMAYFNVGEKVLFPDITYSFYEVYANLLNIDAELVPLNDDFTIPLDKFKGKNLGIIIPNPNAPTSIGLDKGQIREIIASNPNKVVIIDEAYIDFGGETVVDLIKEYNNLLVIQTTSKSRALAGLRVGFAMGNVDLIEALERIKNSINSYTLDRLAIAGAAEAFRDVEYFDTTRNKIIKTREEVTEYLKSVGFKVLPSKANFIFISHDKIGGKTLYDELRSRGILVRHFQKDRIDDYLRVSIGSKYEMEVFCKTIKEIIEG